VGSKDGTTDQSALAARYSAAFSAYLADRGEQELGAAYDIGREAVAAKLSVLDLADAHHSALAAATRGDDATLAAAADFLRESLSTFETVHRGYLEVQEVARLEHEHVDQLRALADASVAINSSLTVEAILQLTADTARGIIRSARATVAILAPDPRLRPLTATSPSRLGGVEPQPSRLTANLTGRGKELGVLEVVDVSDREFTARDEAILTQLAQLASVAISNAQLYERERTIARTLQRSLRPGALPPVPGLSAAVRFRPAGEGIELGGDFYDLFAAGDGAWTALIGDVQGKGPDASAAAGRASRRPRDPGRAPRHPARLRHRTAADRHRGHAPARRGARPLHRRRHRGPAPPSGGLRPPRAGRVARDVRGPTAGRGGRSRGSGSDDRFRRPVARRHGDPGLRPHTPTQGDR
jgi:GAF domain-containing protein